MHSVSMSPESSTHLLSNRTSPSFWEAGLVSTVGSECAAMLKHKYTDFLPTGEVLRRMDGVFVAGFDGFPFVGICTVQTVCTYSGSTFSYIPKWPSGGNPESAPCGPDRSSFLTKPGKAKPSLTYSVCTVLSRGPGIPECGGFIAYWT